jgi:hypothetical protein
MEAFIKIIQVNATSLLVNSLRGGPYVIKQLVLLHLQSFKSVDDRSLFTAVFIVAIVASLRVLAIFFCAVGAKDLFASDTRPLVQVPEVLLAAWAVIQDCRSPISLLRLVRSHLLLNYYNN